MKKQFTLIGALALSCNLAVAQFNTSPTQWNVPNSFEDAYDAGKVSGTVHTTMDINGDGKPDLIDGMNESASSVWLNGSQKYWKVYVNSGSGFSSTPTQWNVPNSFEDAYDAGKVSGTVHTTMDINGDGLPDLIDGMNESASSVWLNGSQKYWKVYVNSGSGFSLTPTQWNVPNGFEDAYDAGKVSGTVHTTMDINGDGLPDLIDGMNESASSVWLNGSQKYWKVYVNSGSGFSLTPTQWNVPNSFEDAYDAGKVSGTVHTTMDINGDGLPDLIDGMNESASSVWLNGSQKYWKVYVNTGSGFSSTPTQWNVPNGFEDAYDAGKVSGTVHTTMEINGDGLPDLIDGMNESASSVWLNGSQKYWKVYVNTGAGFSLSPTQWNVPNSFEDAYDAGKVSGTVHTTMDLDGDYMPDLIDGMNESASSVWLNGSQKYWKLYKNTLTNTTGIEVYSENGFENLTTYPNPTDGIFSINLSELSSPTVNVFNSLGSLIYKGNGNGNSIFTFDLGQHEAGIYFIKVLSDNNLYSARVIKK